MKLCAQPFPPIFGLFAIFDRNFSKVVAPPSDRLKNYLAPLKKETTSEETVENKMKIDP